MLRRSLVSPSETVVVVISLSILVVDVRCSACKREPDPPLLTCQSLLSIRYWNLAEVQGFFGKSCLHLDVSCPIAPSLGAARIKN